MSEQNYIISGALPLSQNFHALKEQGLKVVEEISGDKWTNLNDSDPGVTTLDQLCYALTELGYCTDFPMRDLLTEANGELKIKNQFYLPEQILTVVPSVFKDFEKFIIDAFPVVDNVRMMDKTTAEDTAFQYQLFIAASALKTSAQRDLLCNQVYYKLNTVRPLNVKFKSPQFFETISVLPSGDINIESKAVLLQVIRAIEQRIAHFILPKVESISYQVAFTEGDYSINEIFEGPLLKNGFISDDALGEKVKRFTDLNIANLITNTKGVVSITDFSLYENGEEVKAINVAAEELAIFDWVSAISTQQLRFYTKGKLLDVSQEILDQMMQPANKQEAVLDGNTEFFEPKPGSFRDVNSYYPVQETFPEIYNVGSNAIKPNDSDLKKAQSAQFKGYLTLFDQVLANQFAQLANVGTLFSFTNAKTAAPSDLKAFYAVKNRLEPEKSEYPIPYQLFSPTYFYQSLYNVPDIRPLLKNNSAFNFSAKTVSEKIVEEEGWKAYQHDPYNPYIKGLMDLVVQEDLNITRRNALLNHLLARHGESPELIDLLIDGAGYTGDPEKDRVIVKSIYLQNLATLTYHQGKAMNYAAMDPLKNIGDLEIPITKYQQERSAIDFTVATDWIDKEEKISSYQINNQSSFELKLALLFGLKPLYKDVILDLAEKDLVSAPQQMKQLNWLITQRSGFILLETMLLDDWADPDWPDIIAFFPSYINAVNSIHFRDKIQHFINDVLAINLTFKALFVNEEDMGIYIRVFTAVVNDFGNKAVLQSFNSDEKLVFQTLVNQSLSNHE